MWEHIIKTYSLVRVWWYFNESFIKVGIWLENFFENFTVIQNYSLSRHDIFFRWLRLACQQSMVTIWFSANDTSSMWMGTLLLMPVYSGFVFLIFVQTIFFIHSRLHLGLVVSLGMHSSITAISLSSNMFYYVSMSLLSSRKVQCIASSRWLALLELAWEYLQVQITRQKTQRLTEAKAVMIIKPQGCCDYQ